MSTRTSQILIISGIVISCAFTVWWFTEDLHEKRVMQQSALEDGVNAFNEKNYQQAFSKLSQVPSGHAQAWRARYYEGSTYILLKDYAAAVPLLEEALELNPVHSRSMHALGVAHFKLGHLALAKAYFAQVLEVDPSDEEARGLMDIMANLERIQPENAEAHPTNEG